MIGAIIGDIIGSPYELLENNINFDEIELFNKNSHFTDDTLMTLAVAMGAIKGYRNKDLTKKEIVDYMRKLGNKYTKVKYGPNFKLWLVLNEPMPYNSFGNGGAMRVSSIAWLYNNLKDVEDFAEIVTEVTHNHPEGIKGAKAIAAAIYLSRQGASKEYIKNYISEKYKYNFENIKYYKENKTSSINAEDTVPRALSAFFEGNSFEEIIRISLSLGDDTDTIASMAGAIAEAFYHIPEEIRINALEYLDSDLKSLISSYNNFLDNIHSINYNKYQKILDYKQFFDKNEVIEWIATNNRKTKNFYTNYGEETNELINFVKDPIFVDYDYQKTLKLLNIKSFKEYIPTASPIALRAILTSIVARERFGIGNIGRASKDGLISSILYRLDEILNYKML